MRHFASPEFRTAYRRLPNDVRLLADKNFALLKNDVGHSSLHFKKVGRYFSARVGLKHRAVALPVDGNMLWFWIGTHAEYDMLIG